MKFDSATPYAAVFIMIAKDGKYAFVKRANTGWWDGYYGLPSGKVEKDESFSQAAMREAKEEVGVDISLDDLSYRGTAHRRSVDSDWVDVIFEATKWSGEVINAEPEVHSEVAWFALDDLPENTVPHQRLLLDALAKGEQFVEEGWVVS